MPIHLQPEASRISAEKYRRSERKNKAGAKCCRANAILDANAFMLFSPWVVA